MSDDQGEHEIDDLWLNAFAAFPDVRPLVRLLRCPSVPMPPGARDTLAELLSPVDPPIDSFVLELKPNAKFGKMFPEIDAVYSYANARDAGESSENAAAKAGEQHLVVARQIHRYRARLKRLGDRLRGADKSH
jgi:hypothetical protein